jgi:hypothetical protein
VSDKLQQVHVRVNDAATGEPTPCRIRFTDPSGTYYAPYGRPASIPSDLFRLRFCIDHVSGVLPDGAAYIDGTCEILLPSGPLHVSIQKGPEYEIVQQEIHLPAGKAALRFELHRLINPAASGWYSGALVQLPLTPHDVLLEGAAEGVQVVDLLAYERDTIRAAAPTGVERLNDFPNLVAFSGQQPCVATDHCLLAVNTLNVHDVLGSLALVHCHRVIYPLRFGPSPFDRHGRPEQRTPDNWTLAAWCDQCHRKHGLVIATRIGVAQPSHAGELLADLLLGKVDAVMDCDDLTWHLLLGLGLKVPRVASGMTTRPIASHARTYAQLAPGEALSYTSWIQAIRSGRTTVSRGPHLTMTANGRGLGEQIDLEGPDRTVIVQADANARDRFDRIEILYDGRVVHTADARYDRLCSASTEWAVPIRHSGWLAARCTRLRNSDGAPTIEAYTSPIYLRVGDRPPPADPWAMDVVLQCLDHMAAWADRDARCETEQDRQRLVDVFAGARNRLPLGGN